MRASKKSPMPHLSEHEIDVGPAARRADGAADARGAEPSEQLAKPLDGTDFRGVDFAVDRLLLVGERGESLFADHLFGQDAAA